MFREHDLEQVQDVKMKALSKPEKVLMLAYVFPPFFSVGGSIRVVKFIKYLTNLGWQPSVLTIDDQHEYDMQRKVGSETLLADIPDDIAIYRTTTGELPLNVLEAGRELRRRNRLAGYLVNVLRALRRQAQRFLMIPDEQISWLPFALRHGWRIVKDEHVRLLFATCPPHSTAIIATLLSTLTSLPLILDFRDDWIDTPWHHRKPRITRQVERLLERWVVRSAERVILVTAASQSAFEQRYSKQPREKFIFIPNGCDLADFELEKQPERKPGDTFRIVHAGLLTEAEDWHRSPGGFFQGVVEAAQMQPALASDVEILFTGRLPAVYMQIADQLGLNGVVRDLGHLPRADYIDLLRNADLLLAINYEDFSTLIPGKLYEYWAAGHAPILLLSAPGAARELISNNNLGICALPDDVHAIRTAILEVYTCWKMGNPRCIRNSGVLRYDRARLSRKLAGVFMETLSAVQDRSG